MTEIIFSLTQTHSGLKLMFCKMDSEEEKKPHNPLLRHVPTWPMVDESHMAVVYCLSSSGALSFKSRVSIATTTLDTWLGLSERAEIKRRNFESEERGVLAERPRCRNTRDTTNTSVLLRHSGCICTPLSPFNCPYKRDQAFQALAQKKFQQLSDHIRERTIG